MAMSLNYWINNIADLPTMDANGEWYDAETGFTFKSYNEAPAKIERPAKAPQHEKMILKIDEMKKDAERVVAQEQYLDKCPESVRQMKIELIAYTKELLSRNAKKAEFCKMYDMRTAVGQAENKAKK